MIRLENSSIECVLFHHMHAASMQYCWGELFGLLMRQPQWFTKKSQVDSIGHETVRDLTLHSLISMPIVNFLKYLKVITTHSSSNYTHISTKQPAFLVFEVKKLSKLSDLTVIESTHGQLLKLYYDFSKETLSIIGFSHPKEITYSKILTKEVNRSHALKSVFCFL